MIDFSIIIDEYVQLSMVHYCTSVTIISELSINCSMNIKISVSRAHNRAKLI